MPARTSMVLALALALAGATVVEAAPTGVQWTPDATAILVSKDVDDSRWTITFKLVDASVTGNVFFRDDRAPGFLWCDKIGESFDESVGELTFRYECFGSDGAVGGFAFDDWRTIENDVFLPASFFIPPPETCDLADAVNGFSADDADTFWQCNGNAGNFDLQVFGDGTGISSATGELAFDVVGQACTFGRLDDGSFLDVEYSPSRDRLTVYEIPAAVDEVIVSECERRDL